MKKYAKLCTLIGGLLVTLSFTHNAFAYDFKVFAGSECQANNQAATGVSYYSTGVYNGSGASQWVTCPVVRDASFNTNGTWVRAAATVASFCYLDNTNLNGTLGTWKSFNTGANTYSAFQQLTVSGSSTPYSMLCSLANGTRLTAYQTAEYDPTDVGN